MNETLLAALRLDLSWNSTVVALGTASFGAAAGLIGCFVLLRGRALIADAAAHATLPGVVGAFLIAVLVGADPRSLPLLLGGAGMTAALGVVTVRALSASGRVREDAAMAVVLSVGFGAGVALLSVVQALPVGGQAGLSHFILGQAAGMAASDAWLIASLAAVSLLFVVVLFNPLRALCFDSDFAQAQGLPVRTLDLALLGLMLAVTVTGLSSVGLVLVVALMVIPAVAARLATERLSVMAPLAALIGAASGWFGTALSASRPELPTGAVITLVACAVFLLMFLGAPSRGLLAAGWRRARLALRVGRDHFLRGAWELHEGRGEGEAAAFPLSDLAAAWGWGPLKAQGLAALARAEGFARPTAPGCLALTDRGVAEARAVTRRHRLWEHYLQEAGGVRALTAHRGADLIEHTLPPEFEAQAEAWLESHAPARTAGVMPPPGETAAERGRR